MRNAATCDSCAMRPVLWLSCAAVWCVLAITAPAMQAAESPDAHAIFKTLDHGRSWSRADTGMPASARINAFAAIDASIFAGTDSGIYMSLDEARTWNPATGLAMHSGRILGLAALGPSLYAGTDRSGLLVSHDRGLTWTAHAGLSSKKIRCLLADQGKVYVGTDSEGVFVSSDGAASWTPMRQGLPEHAQLFAMSAVAGRLYAALYSKGLYAWNEQQQHWTKAGAVSPLALATVGDTLIAGHNPGGLFWSDDQGATWSQGAAAAISSVAQTSVADTFATYDRNAPVWALAGDHDWLLAGASAGIYYSEDRGRSWSRAGAGLPATSPGISFLMSDRFALAGTLVGNGARGD
jgi:hypothetical protein